MRRTMWVLAAAGLMALACGGGDTSGDGDAAAVADAAEIARRKAMTDAAVGGDSSKPDPLAGRSIAEICADDSLALVRWDYDQLQSSFAELCCGPGKLEGDVPGADRCHMDWPFNDVPDCSAYSVLRNGIFARYGYPFSKQEWKDAFGGQAWYQRRDDFDSSWLSSVAQGNVQRLKELEADGIQCMNY